MDRGPIIAIRNIKTNREVPANNIPALHLQIQETALVITQGTLIHDLRVVKIANLPVVRAITQVIKGPTVLKIVAIISLQRPILALLQLEPVVPLADLIQLQAAEAAIAHVLILHQVVVQEAAVAA